MPANSLHPGMCNFPVNMTVEERALIGRAAFGEDRSSGSFFKRMFLRGLEAEYPELAAEIKSIREKHRLAARIAAGKAAGVALLALTSWLWSFSATSGDELTVRNGRAGARVVHVRGGRRTEEVAV